MNKEKDPIMKRMKDLYELRQRHYLTRRTPVIIRCDLKAAHTYCKPLKDKFHEGFIKVMNLTAIKLAEEIQGCQIAYIQSDEVSILLHDYKRLTSDAWFNYCQNKVESISAAIASATFSLNSWHIWKDFSDSYQKSAYFDSRSFNLPESDVCNYFYARQRDAVKNSINSLAQSLYHYSELQGKNSSQLQEMCFQAGVNWNDLPTYKKRGRCVIKQTYTNEEGAIRSHWVVDNEIPEFSQDRNYIEKYLPTEDDN